MKKQKKLYRKIIAIIVLVYAIITLVNQQKTINQYTSTSKDLATQITEQEQHKEELAKKKEDVNSLEFIEEMAREQLEMYYPNERVYIDTGM